MKRMIILACLLLLPLPALAMTVEEAYKAIPHKQTTFDAASATMPADEKEFLDALFTLVDMAVVERVQSMQEISSGKTTSFKYDELEQMLLRLGKPEKLKTVYMLVGAAIQEQRKFLEQWKAGGTFNINDPLVSSSSAKLVQAYGELMRIYPSESAHNKQAFFDHLCALDFK